DLSGKGGLGPNFYGDDDMVTPQPQLRYEGRDGEMADGIFNPFLRKGYLSPATSSQTTVTPSPSLSQILGCVQFDDISNTLIFGERSNKLYQAEGLADTTLTKVLETEEGTTIHDLEVYEINGNRKLFYSYVTNENVLTTTIAPQSE